MTDFELLKLSLDIFQIVCIGGVAVYTWLANKNKANTSAINRVDERVSELSTRISSLETRIDHMPGDRHIKEIHDKINQVANAQSESSGQLSSIVRQLEMINIHLLKGNGD